MSSRYLQVATAVRAWMEPASTAAASVVARAIFLLAKVALRYRPSARTAASPGASADDELGGARDRLRPPAPPRCVVPAK